MRQVIRDAVCPIIVVRVPVAPAAGRGAESPGGPRCGDVMAQTMKGAAVVVFDLDGVILRVADLAQVQLAGRRPDARVAV